jgi:NADPH:quinone reductase-like Zn-dependent oxidoreductase
MGTATMTAAVVTGHGDLEALRVRHDVPLPRPVDGQVLVRVSAAAVNNTDVWTRQGAYGLPGRPEALAGWRGPIAFPRIQGGDVVGTTVELGEAVDPTLLGRRVLVDPALYRDEHPQAPPVGLLGSEADGGFAEYMVVSAEQVHDVTESPLPDEQLACLPIAYGTATGMLERAALRPDETVLVTGASGGVGLALVQLAAARGATVIAVTSSAKAAEVRAAGADHVLCRDGRDLAEQVTARSLSSPDE